MLKFCNRVLDRKYRDYMLSFDQKDLLKIVIRALEPYEELTDLLSGESMVTSTSIAPMLRFLEGITEEFAHSELDDDIQAIRTKIWTYIKSKYDIIVLLYKQLMV